MRVVVVALVACSSAPAPKLAQPEPPDTHMQRLFPLELAPRPELTTAIELNTPGAPIVNQGVVSAEFAIALALEHCGASTLLAADERDNCEQALCHAGGHRLPEAITALARCTHVTEYDRAIVASVLAQQLDAAEADHMLAGMPIRDEQLVRAVISSYEASGQTSQARTLSASLPWAPPPVDRSKPCRALADGVVRLKPAAVLSACGPFGKSNVVSLAAAYLGWPAEQLTTAERWLEVARAADTALPAHDAAVLDLAALGNAAQVALCSDESTVTTIRNFAVALGRISPDDRAAAEAIAARPCAYHS